MQQTLSVQVNENLRRQLHYILRIAVAMCFIGHGAFGLITKEIWCNYFAIFGIDKPTAYTLMPWVGGIDILLGIVMLIYPMRALAGWLVFWGLFTALLRPLSGEPFAEFIERAGNYGAPFVLLVLSGKFLFTKKYWFQKLSPGDYSGVSLLQITICLQVVVFLLLAGHGWLNLLEKQGLINQYTRLGFSNPVQVAHIVGITEIAGALLLLIKPVPEIVFAFLLWKIISEVFYPQYPLFEWIERGGSYASLLALWLVTKSYRVAVKRTTSLQPAT